MTHARPIPEASQSPYPIAEPPHPHDTATQPVVVADDADDGLLDRARDLPLVAIGAAVGLGLALIGGALFGLRGTRGKRGKRGGRRARRG